MLRCKVVTVSAARQRRVGRNVELRLLLLPAVGAVRQAT
jgi:hypothetical protein